MKRTTICSLALACLIFNLTGCALLKLGKHQFPATGPKNPAVRIIGMWQPSEGMWEGRTTRGFSGQIMFFGINSDAPAKVNGEVVIYVFDDQGQAEEQAKPIHEFKFPADSWNALLADGPLGATYGVFVPYTRPGIHSANCTLRVRYTPASGHPLPVYSEMVNLTLAGTKKQKSASASAAGDDPAGVVPNDERDDDGAKPRDV